MRKLNLLFSFNFIDEKKNKNIVHIETKIHNTTIYFITKIYFIVAIKIYIINLLILIIKYYKL